MNLKRLAINRLPGIGQPFEIEAAGKGIHIVFGPNAIGKSSICRAIRGLYWQDREPSRQISIYGEFESGGATWRVEREGSALRWSRGDNTSQSPNLPPSHTDRCFFLHLRDLIDTSSDGTADIATEIHRQMSGGFDLDTIRSDLFSPVTHHRMRAERESFNRSSEAVGKAESHHASLQRRVDRLERLQSQLDKAETASSRRANIDRAIGLAQRRDKLAGVKERLGALPGALAKQTGNECDDINDRQGRLTRLEEQSMALESDLSNALADQKNSALARPLDKADLTIWRGKADKLERIEQALEAARNDREAAHGKLASSLAAIGSRDADSTPLSLPDHARLFEFLRDSHSTNTRIGAINERLRLLKGPDSPDDCEQELVSLREACDALRTWLRQANSGAVAGTLRARRYWLLLAFALLLAGIALAISVDPLLATIAGIGAGIGLAKAVPGNDTRHESRRKAAQEAFTGLGFQEPGRWDVPSVGVALRTLENRAATLEALLQRASAAEVERSSLQSELEGLTGQERQLEIRRQELSAGLGLESLRQDADLVDFARALDALRLARADYDAMNGKVQEHESSHTALLGELAGVLAAHGEPRPDGAVETKARLHNLADRNSRLQTALAAEQTAETQLGRNAASREVELAAIRRIYARAELEDDDLQGLRSLLEDLPRYAELEGQRKDLESKIDLDRSELAKAGESGLSDMDVQSLEELNSKSEHARSQAEDLRKEIFNVNADLNRARHGSDLQNLIADREEARATLHDLRDSSLFATAGDFLVGDIEQEYEQTRMPRVFDRAREHFTEFTRHNYELRLQRGNGNPRLFALDLRDRRRRELDELSDGTRAQLLLAARIAFAEEVERGEVLPLFLDEALDQSDPQRFEAIVRSLGCVAQDQGRQIFYLTSDPLDVDRIRDALGNEGCEIAAAIDLGSIRTRAASVSGPEMLAFEPPAPVPAPNGLTPEEYATVLGVPAFRPTRGFAEQHLYYVLSDNLDVLHRFLTNGVERAGQWKTVRDTSLALKLGDKSVTADEVGSRLDLLEVFCELWNQGRGKPVDRDALLDSDTLTARFFDDVAAIAAELGGNPERLIDALAERRDSRLRGFQSRSVERLRHYLSEHGYIDDRSTLAEAELQLRALATPAAISLSDDVAISRIQRWWQWAEKSSAPETAKQAR